jgi:predicted PurR-regulated permease PerM
LSGGSRRPGARKERKNKAMKKRIISSVIIFAIYTAATQIYKLVYPPVASAATAAQMDDTAQSFVQAKFLRDQLIERTAFWLLIFLLVCIWIGPVWDAINKAISKLNKKKNENK